MKLEWIGHACFKMTAANGTTVITDPYDESVGIGMIPLCADLITMSHEHHDHNETCMVRGTPVIVHGDEPACVGGVTACAAASYHDDAQGALRGKNFIRIFEIDGLKVVHMGDQGCMPDAAALDAIMEADVMLIPVGGTYTVDAAGAKAIIAAAKPKCVVPMHAKTKHCPYPIAPMQDFLAVMGEEDAAAHDAAEICGEQAICGVLLMKPQADELC